MAGSHLGITRGSAAENKAEIPSIAEKLPDLWLFLEKLDAAVKSGTIRSTEQLIERCKEFYTAERMAKIEAVVPGWTHMASFEQGKTLWHINVAMVALLQLDEYRSMSPIQQTVQWIVLTTWPRNRLVGAIIDTASAQRRTQDESCPRSIPGDRRLSIRVPGVVNLQTMRCNSRRRTGDQDSTLPRTSSPGRSSPSRRDSGHHNRTASVHNILAAWPVKAPLTDDQVIAYVDKDLVTTLLPLTLADSAGWNLFEPKTSS
jgi:hypothetical protein